VHPQKSSTGIQERAVLNKSSPQGNHTANWLTFKENSSKGDKESDDKTEAGHQQLDSKKSKNSAYNSRTQKLIL
jgi:hypothetical protein